MTDSALPLQFLGRLVRLQIQPQRLRSGAKPDQVYDPSGLLAVETLTLAPNPGGAQAERPDGERVLDIHHAAHPQSGNVDGINDLSIGFTTHYALARQRYGGGLADGLAGENLLVDTPERVTLAQLRGGLAIRSARSGRTIWLSISQVAAPCRPFSTFVLGGPAEPQALKEALQFLDDGLRGFYGSLRGREPAEISVGDQVFLPGG